MAKVFACPFKQPLMVYDLTTTGKQLMERDKAFIESVLDWVKKHYQAGDYVGEVLTIPHADGKAVYIVASLKPVTLIHVPVGDAWDSPHADLQTAKSIKQSIDGEKRLNELFKKIV